MSIDKIVKMHQVQDHLIKPLAISTLIQSYALITVQGQKECKDEPWYKQAQQVSKYYKKRKPDPVSEATDKKLLRIYEKVKNFDADFFTDKPFSPYLPMILLLDYMIYEVKDLECRSKFLHLNTRTVIKEMEETSWLKEVGFSTHRYVSGVIEIVEGKR